MLLIISQAYSKRNVTKENYSLKGRMKEREKKIERMKERKKSMKFLDTGPWDGFGGQGRPTHTRINAKHGLCAIVMRSLQRKRKRLEIIKNIKGNLMKHFIILTKMYIKIVVEKFVVFTRA